MSQEAEPVLLDLRALHRETELSRQVMEARALATSVVLDRLHGARDHHAATIDDATRRLAATLRRVPIDARARDTCADPQQATEAGGEAVAFLVARRVLGRIVFRRLPKATGADYLMRDPTLADGDTYERLECSGIADGAESAARRLRSKLQQLARYPHQPPGHAVVTNFRVEPIEILTGSWRP